MVLYPLGQEGLYDLVFVTSNMPWDFDLNTKEGSKYHAFLRPLNGKTVLEFSMVVSIFCTMEEIFL